MIDANLPRAAARTLRAFGHTVDDVRDVGLAYARDEWIHQHALQNGQTLITRDLDFADVRAYPPANSPGYLVVRVPETFTVIQIDSLLRKFFATSDWISHIPGHLVILEPDRVRFRPPLQDIRGEF